MTSNAQFDSKTTGTEVTAAFGDGIRGKNGESVYLGGNFRSPYNLLMVYSRHHWCQSFQYWSIYRLGSSITGTSHADIGLSHSVQIGSCGF